MTEVEERLFDALISYRFLIRDQMHELGVCSDRGHLGNVLGRLKRRGYVGEMPPQLLAGGGKLPAMWYLTKKGAKLIEEYRRLPDESVPYTKGQPKDRTHRRHRKGCVDCHIALDRWCGATGRKTSLYVPDYPGQVNADSIMSTRVELPDGKEFRPDAIMVVKREQEATGRIYTLEYSTNQEARDTKRISRQLEAHRLALKEGSIGEKLGIPMNFRALWVFQDQPGLDAVRNRVSDNADYAPAADYFLFNVLARLGDDFGAAWVNLRGEPVGL